MQFLTDKNMLKSPLLYDNDINRGLLAVFFGGRGVDDLFWPMHLNFKFFGMKPLETFACHDVLKNPEVENDFIRFEARLNKLFPSIN